MPENPRQDRTRESAAQTHKLRPYGDIDVDMGMTPGAIDRLVVAVPFSLLQSKAAPYVLNMLSETVSGPLTQNQTLSDDEKSKLRPTLVVTDEVRRITVKFPSQAVKLLGSHLKGVLETFKKLEVPEPQQTPQLPLFKDRVTIRSPSRGKEGEASADTPSGRWEILDETMTGNPLKAWLRNNATPVAGESKLISYTYNSIEHASYGAIDIDTGTAAGAVKRLEVEAPLAALGNGIAQDILNILSCAVREPLGKARYIEKDKKSNYLPVLTLAEGGNNVTIRIPSEVKRLMGERAYKELHRKIEALNVHSLPSLSQIQATVKDERQIEIPFEGEGAPPRDSAKGLWLEFKHPLPAEAAKGRVWDIAGPSVTSETMPSPGKPNNVSWEVLGPGSLQSEVDNAAAMSIYTTLLKFSSEALKASPAFEEDVGKRMRSSRGTLARKKAVEEASKSFLPSFMAQNGHGRLSVKIPDKTVHLLGETAQEEIVRELDAMKKLDELNKQTTQTLHTAFPDLDIHFAPAERRDRQDLYNSGAAWTVKIKVPRPDKRTVSGILALAGNKLKEQSLVFTPSNVDGVGRDLADSLRKYYSKTRPADALSTDAVSTRATGDVIELTVNRQLAEIMPEWVQKSKERSFVKKLLKPETPATAQSHGRA